MKILNSYRKKNNKSNKRSRRSIRLIKNGGGRKEDLINQIGDIIERIYSIEEAAAYGSQWSNASGPNSECDALEKQKDTLIDQFKSEFPSKIPCLCKS